MRKIINSLFTLIVISISFTSCEDLSDRIVLNANVEASTELIIQENTPIVLLEANQTEIALSHTHTRARARTHTHTHTHILHT